LADKDETMFTVHKDERRLLDLEGQFNGEVNASIADQKRSA